LPSGGHRRQGGAYAGTEDTPGPGSYAEHAPMGRGYVHTWNVGNNDLFCFLKAAAADDYLPAFWNERYYKVPDLVDEEMGVLIDDQELEYELGVTNPLTRRKILKQAALVHRWMSKRRAASASRPDRLTHDLRASRHVPGPGAYSPRDGLSSPKRSNPIYFASARQGPGRRARSTSAHSRSWRGGSPGRATELVAGASY
jgi:hypothetical protein